MSLEQLIERAQKAERDRLRHSIAGQENSVAAHQAHNELWHARQEIVDFVLAHADVFIAWERQHMLRTSPFDEE